MDLAGKRLRYLQGGAGRPAVLLHGFLGGSFCWRFTLPVLARQYRVYALDLPGLGISEADAQTDCGMAAQAVCVQQFIEKLGLRHVDLIGCSFGGAVALHVALQEKRLKAGRLRSLVLAAPVNPWSRFGRKRLAVLRTSAGGMLLRLAMPYSRPLLPWALRRLYADPACIPAGTLEGYSPLILGSGRAAHVLSAIRSWKRDVEVLRTCPGAIDVPTLLVWGDRDRAVDPASCEALQQCFTDCEVRRLPGVGHLPFEEAPEEFNRVVMEFLGKSN
ncbi:MAG: alpha/beta fold hydrolase [Acidobacteriia bacterium]|nr:alpha/beta fold hydrolase [Terriglobia bacterium]